MSNITPISSSNGAPASTPVSFSSTTTTSGSNKTGASSSEKTKSPKSSTSTGTSASGAPPAGAPSGGTSSSSSSSNSTSVAVVLSDGTIETTTTGADGTQTVTYSDPANPPQGTSGSVINQALAKEASHKKLEQGGFAFVNSLAHANQGSDAPAVVVPSTV